MKNKLAELIEKELLSGQTYEEFMLRAETDMWKREYEERKLIKRSLAKLLEYSNVPIAEKHKLILDLEK